jgi:hypothetical protein
LFSTSHETELEPQAPKVSADVRAMSFDAPIPKETKTAEGLARMIEADLAKHPDCPTKGL